MEIAEALDHLRTERRGVLMTQRGDGRPQSSNVMYGVGDDGIIRISVTADRAKTKNVERTPLASLHVSRPDFWAYAVVDADAELSRVAADPADETVEELVSLYRSLQGEHDDWDDYRRSMVADRRLVLRLRPTHAYGMWSDG
ncbi:MAG: PPOX class F420-dependent oxidoreductase [Acidimicrobiales bacterium]